MLIDHPLVHYARDLLDGPVRGATVPLCLCNKPNGFWFSVEDGDGWRDWCESEQFGLSCLAHKYAVVLRPGAAVLHLKSVAGIDSFTDQFAAADGKINQILPGRIHDINWRAVAARWQGVIIAPYQWKRRLDSRCAWYYGWDCSSGCVWDAEAIASVEPISEAA